MQFLYRFYQLFFYFPIFIVLTILTAVVTALGCAVGLSRWFAFTPSRIWGWLTIRLLFLPVKVEGREHLQRHQSYVFVANHQGAFDIFLLSGFLGREFKWMMKASLRKLPLRRLCLRKSRFHIRRQVESSRHCRNDGSRAPTLGRRYFARRLPRRRSLLHRPHGTVPAVARSNWLTNCNFRSYRLRSTVVLTSCRAHAISISHTMLRCG